MDAESGSGPDLPWRRSALTECSRLLVIAVLLLLLLWTTMTMMSSLSPKPVIISYKAHAAAFLAVRKWGGATFGSR